MSAKQKKQVDEEVTTPTAPEVETPAEQPEAPAEEVAPAEGILGDGRKPAIKGEPKKSFAERTQETQPWAGTEGVDDTRPEPTIEKPKEEE